MWQDVTVCRVTNGCVRKRYTARVYLQGVAAVLSGAHEILGGDGTSVQGAAVVGLAGQQYRGLGGRPGSRVADVREV